MVLEPRQGKFCGVPPAGQTYYIMRYLISNENYFV